MLQRPERLPKSRGVPAWAMETRQWYPCEECIRVTSVRIWHSKLYRTAICWAGNSSLHREGTRSCYRMCVQLFGVELTILKITDKLLWIRWNYYWLFDQTKIKYYSHPHNQLTYIQYIFPKGTHQTKYGQMNWCR